jgi:transcriptional regulator with XRE-family HTH domain
LVTCGEKEQVAQRSGVHETEVRRIEAGKRDPQVSTLRRLAKAVEVKPGQPRLDRRDRWHYPGEGWREKRPRG